MSMMLNAAARHIAGYLFGSGCHLCRGAAPLRTLLCSDCETELPRIAPAMCPHCILPSAGGALCARCLAQPPSYDATLAALRYGFPADVLVHALKFRGELAIAPLLARLLIRAIDARDRPEYVVPVPLYAARLARRGYNQAGEVARALVPQHE